MESVSIIMPLYNPNKSLLKRIEKSIKNQDYKGKVKLIKVDEHLGLAEQANHGIKKAKTKIVIILEQDCIPATKSWLKKLVEPVEKGAITSVSKVDLPYELWEKFDLVAKIMSAKEQKIITPLMDEKGCAYKKDALIKAGMFDSKNFRTAGEDFDMWIKLKKLGEIAYPDCKIIHYHIHTAKNRIKKEIQLSNGFGALTRIYGIEMPKFWLGFLKSIPIIGWPLFLLNYPYIKVGASSVLWIPLSLLNNILYSYGFWKGFIDGKQTI